MTEVTKPGRCQVRSNTESPCPRPAAVEISGIPFCRPCASEQEAYFAIGELTRGKHSLPSKPLAEVLERMRQEEPAGSTDGIAATMPHGLSGVDETKPLAFRKS